MKLNKAIILSVFLFLAVFPPSARAVDPGTVAAVVVGALVVNEIDESIDDFFKGLSGCLFSDFMDVYIRAVARAAGASKEDVSGSEQSCGLSGGKADENVNRPREKGKTEKEAAPGDSSERINKIVDGLVEKLHGGE